MHIQVGQPGHIEASVTTPVRALSTGKYIRTFLKAFEREAKFFGDALACLVTTRVSETDTPHRERTEGVTHQGVGCLGGEPATLGALADPVPRVTLAALPVDVMQAAPDHCFTGRTFDSHQLYAFTQDETRHDMSNSDFHGFGCEELAVFSPSHPCVQIVPGLGNRRRGGRPVASLFGSEKQARRSDRHWNINQHWI